MHSHAWTAVTNTRVAQGTEETYFNKPIQLTATKQTELTTALQWF